MSLHLCPGHDLDVSSGHRTPESNLLPVRAVGPLAAGHGPTPLTGLLSGIDLVRTNTTVGHVLARQDAHAGQGPGDL